MSVGQNTHVVLTVVVKWCAVVTQMIRMTRRIGDVTSVINANRKGNAMKITNVYGLPSAFVRLSESDFKYTDKEYRVTSLLKGVRETLLADSPSSSG